VDRDLQAGSGMTRKIMIFGTGKGADIARRYIESDTGDQIAGHVVDPEYLTDSLFHGRPVATLDQATRLFPPDDVLAFVPMGAGGMNRPRQEKYEALKGLGYRFYSYVHSSNRAAVDCTIGGNCLILENQSLNFDTAIGDNVVMWSGCQLGDRSRIGSHAYLGAHVVINGDVEIGEGSYLGSNSTISHGVKVGAQSFIGANALISENTKDRAVHVVPSTPALEIDSLRFMKLMRRQT
jgi:sugar O-acyltransferase (sialic acid O-acetyltransferase NeuD family)